MCKTLQKTEISDNLFFFFGVKLKRDRTPLTGSGNRLKASGDGGVNVRQERKGDWIKLDEGYFWSREALWMCV